MKKMLMMATTAAMIEQFNKNNILILEEMGYEVHVAGNWKEGNPISDNRLERFKFWLSDHNGKWFQISATRNPINVKNNHNAYKKLLKLIKENKYEFIHCHTPIGSVLARLAAHKTNTKVIYTAHGFHFFQGAPLKNWLLYYPIEKLLSKWTDVLITINKEDYDIAKRFYMKKREYVPGVGIDINYFCYNERIREKKRKELGLKEDDILLLSVGEIIPRKNHKFAIKLISKLNHSNVKYIICGKGNKDKLLKEVRKFKVEDKVMIIGFTNDIVGYCNAADIFLFPSLQEGLPLALLEAMACNLPVLSNNIRGNRDLISKEYGEYLLKSNNIKEYIIKLDKLIEDESLRRCIGIDNRKASLEFNIELINKQMYEIYTKIEEY